MLSTSKSPPILGDVMPPATTTMPVTLRVVRTVHATLAVAMVLYVCVAEFFLHPAVQPVDAAFYGGIAIVAVVCAVSAVVVRARMLRPAFTKMRTDPDDATSHNRWRVGIFVSDALAMAILLYGFVLRFMGCTTAQAAPFYLGGFVLMILWWPRRP